MGWIQELQNLLHSYSIYTIVKENEMAVYFRRGRAVEFQKKTKPDNLDDLVRSENGLIESNGGAFKCLYPQSLTLPSDYKRNIIGLPRRRERYSKSLEAGFYWHFPWIDEVVKYQKQELKAKIEPISIPIKNGEQKNLSIGANISYELTDAYKYTIAVRMGEVSLTNLAREAVFKYGVGKPITAWENDEQRAAIEKEALEKINEKARTWGLEVLSLETTDIQIIETIRLLSESNGNGAKTSLVPLRR